MGALIGLQLGEARLELGGVQAGGWLAVPERVEQRLLAAAGTLVGQGEQQARPQPLQIVGLGGGAEIIEVVADLVGDAERLAVGRGTAGGGRRRRRAAAHP